MARLPSLNASSLVELIDAGRRDDEHAYSALFERYRVYAWSVALRTTRNRTVAEEAVVDGFAVALGSLHRLRDPLKFPSYLASCVRNEVLMAVRRSKPLVLVDMMDEEAAPDPTPEGALDAAEEHQRAFAAFARLTDREKQVILLIDVEGIPAPDAAASLGVTVNTLYQLVFRARNSLRLGYITPALAADSPPACRECNDNLAAFAKGSASARVVATTELHLSGCADCRQRLAEAREVCGMLTKAGGVVPIGIAASLATKLAARAGAHPTHQSLRHGKRARNAAALAAAAVVLTGSVASAVLLTGSDRRGPVSVARPTAVSPRLPESAKKPNNAPTRTSAESPISPVADAPASPPTVPVALVVLKPLQLSSSLSFDGTGYAISLLEGATLSSLFTATDPNAGAPAPTLSAAGSLPTGIAFTNEGNGTASFSGTATSTGDFLATITATDRDGTSTTAQLFIAVDEPPAFTSSATATGTVGVPFSFSIADTGFPTPSMSATGNLPPGLQWVEEGTTFSIQGTPLSAGAGSYDITVTSTNSVGTTQQVIDITINS